MELELQMVGTLNYKIMIQQILEILKLDLKTDSKYIQIAKGKHKLPTTIKEALKEFKTIRKNQ